MENVTSMKKTVQYIRVPNGALEYIAAKTLHFSWRTVAGSE